MGSNISQNESENLSELTKNGVNPVLINKQDAVNTANNLGTTYVVTQLTKQTTESSERKIIRENYEFFGVISIIYAMFYTFCLYKNYSGITVPLLEIGTIYYYMLVLKKLGIQIKKDSVFYIISIVLLGISICITDDIRLIMMSKFGIMILFMSFLLHHFYDDTKWSFGKYFESLVGLLIITIAACLDPFIDAVKAIQLRQKKKNGKLKYIVIGIMITIPLIFIIMALLLSADRIFENIFVNAVGELLVFENLFYITLMASFSYVVIYSFINAVAKREIKEEVIDRRTWEPIIAITGCVIISFIYILFCGIQIAGLFLGQMQLPEGYTYAQYAREGFFQLLFVCAINLIIVLSCMAFFRDNKILKIMITIISICTYIMIASSAYRMILYIRAYHLTFLRIFVLWALVVIAILMIGIIINIYKETFPLFRYSMVVVTVFYIGLAFSHPDYFVANYNMSILMDAEKESIERKYEEYNNLYYITSLSADAAPVLAKYKSNEEAVIEYFEKWREESEKLGIRNFNFSRFIAGNVAKEYLK